MAKPKNPLHTLYDPKYDDLRYTALALDLRGNDPLEYLDTLRFSILDLLSLVFERRELDLGETECYSANVVTKFVRDLDYAVPVGAYKPTVLQPKKRKKDKGGGIDLRKDNGTKPDDAKKR